MPQEFLWIGDYFDDHEIPFHDGLGTWHLIRKISEKTCQIWHPDPCESVAVYVCEKVGGENAGQKAIVKIRVEYVNLVRAESRQLC